MAIEILKKLYNRVIYNRYFYALKIYTLQFRLYCYKLFLIQYLRIFRDLKKKHSVHSGYQSVIIFDSKTINKIALNQLSTIQLEYDNYNKILIEYPELKNIFPDYSYANIPFFGRYIFSTYYRQVAIDQRIPMAAELFARLRSNNGLVNGFDLNSSIYLKRGLELIGELYGDEILKRIEAIIKQYLRNEYYHIGLSHGDFHSRNMFIDQDNKLKLIDLDCLRFKGIQEIDAIYFAIEIAASDSGIQWYESILKYLHPEISKEDQLLFSAFNVKFQPALAITCMVDRIGQEHILFRLKKSKQMLNKAIEKIILISNNSPKDV